MPNAHEPSFIERHPVASCAVLAYAWTWAIQLPLLASRRGWIATSVNEHWEVLAAFGPFVAALLVLQRLEGAVGVRRMLAELVRWRIGIRGWLNGVGTPFALLVGALGLGRLMTGQWADPRPLSTGEFATLTGWLLFIAVSGVAQGLGEEPGWRGFMLPRLRERHGRLTATLLLWPVWLLWHLPAFLGRPDFGPPQFLAFGLGILAAAIWLTWLMEHSGSLLMAVMWHLWINVTRGMALELSPRLFLTLNTLVMLGAVIIVAVWVVRARRAPQRLPI
jgi:membrane protease YdiL (CAAX protease family)